MKPLMTSKRRVLIPDVLLGTVIAAAIVLTASADLTNCASPPSGLISWWAAEGNALDTVGSNPGVLQNGVGFTSGEVGQAFVFDGSIGYYGGWARPGMTYDFKLKLDLHRKRVLQIY